jgi:hypothetical protein
MSHRTPPCPKPSRITRLLPWVDLLAKLLTVLAAALAAWHALQR